MRRNGTPPMMNTIVAKTGPIQRLPGNSGMLKLNKSCSIGL